MSAASFQLGDYRVIIKAEVYYLRLTIGALAEISEHLPAASPKALALQMKTLSIDKVVIILTALLRPIYGSHCPQIRQDDVEADHLKVIAQIFERSFSTYKTGHEDE